MFVEELCSGTLSFTVSETIYVTSSRCFARTTSTHFIDLFIGEKYRVYDPGRRQVAQHKPQPLIKPLYYLVHYRCFLIGGSVHLKNSLRTKTNVMAEQRPGITHDQLLLSGCQPRRPTLKMIHVSVEQFLNVFEDNPGHFLAAFVATEPGVLTEASGRLQLVCLRRLKQEAISS